MNKQKKHLQNNKGWGIFEVIPMIVVFVMLVGYALGFYGIIHTGTLNSIAARQYAFETFRNRTNLVYFRDRISSNGTAFVQHYRDIGFRYHAIVTEANSGEHFQAPHRPIAVGKQPSNEALRHQNLSSSTVHNEGIFEIGARNQSVDISDAWIMVGYGICLNPTCGGSP